MKKSLPSDDSFNFARSSLIRLIQLKQHHSSVLSQIVTWLLTHSHHAPPVFFCWQCQILSPTVVFIYHPQLLLHTQGILLEVAQQNTLPCTEALAREGWPCPVTSSQFWLPAVLLFLVPAPLPSISAEWNGKKKGTAITQQRRMLQRSCSERVTPY